MLESILDDDDLISEADTLLCSGLIETKTATVSASFNLNQSLNLRYLALNFPKGNVVYDPFSSAFCKGGGYTYNFRPPLSFKKEAKKSFRNQATLELRYRGRRISVCCFCNGKIKISGCRSDEECQRVAELLVNQIKLSDGATEHPQSLHQHSFDIVMRKSDANAGFSVNLGRAAEIVGKCFAVKFEPSLYNGVRISVPLSEKVGRHFATVIIYESGKLACMGKMSDLEMHYAFETVAQMLRKEFQSSPTQSPSNSPLLNQAQTSSPDLSGVSHLILFAALASVSLLSVACQCTSLLRKQQKFTAIPVNGSLNVVW